MRESENPNNQRRKIKYRKREEESMYWDYGVVSRVVGGFGAGSVFGIGFLVGNSAGILTSISIFFCGLVLTTAGKT